jgi:hypothetical protein
VNYTTSVDRATDDSFRACDAKLVARLWARPRLWWVRPRLPRQVLQLKPFVFLPRRRALTLFCFCSYMQCVLRRLIFRKRAGSICQLAFGWAREPGAYVGPHSPPDLPGHGSGLIS